MWGSFSIVGEEESEGRPVEGGDNFVEEGAAGQQETVVIGQVEEGEQVEENLLRE